MKKRKVLLGLILTGVITLTGCSSEKKEEVSNSNSSTSTQTPVKSSNEAKLGEKIIFENNIKTMKENMIRYISENKNKILNTLDNIYNIIKELVNKK